MGPAKYAGRSGGTAWRFWRHPALTVGGLWDVAVCRAGAVLTRSTRKGYTLAARWVAFTAEDTQGQMDQVLDLAEDMMRRRGKAEAGIAYTPHADAGELLERWPTLGGWFTDPTFDDGTERKGGWVGISCRDGLWSALMKDEGEALQIVVSAPSPLQLLDLMEHALTSPTAPWRHDPKAKGGAKGKK